MCREKKEFKIIKKDKGKEFNYFDKNWMFQFVNNLARGTEKKDEVEKRIEELVPFKRIAVPYTNTKTKDEVDAGAENEENKVRMFTSNCYSHRVAIWQDICISFSWIY